MRSQNGLTNEMVARIGIADDIDNIQQVAASIADGAFYNNGQSCCSVERIYVHESVFDEYLSEFIKETLSWKTGAPTEEGIYFGPLTRKEQLNVLEKQVADALSKGARLITGGKRLPGKGYYFEPTIIVDVTHDMDLMKEESFGPVIGIMKVKNDAEATRLMADTDYGLTAAVYSRDRDRLRILQQPIRDRLLNTSGVSTIALEWQEPFRIWHNALSCGLPFICETQSMASAI